jgi:hypothetical protein
LIGLEFAASVAVFALIGYAVDLQAGTKPVWTLVGMSVGLIGGGYNMFKSVRAMQRREAARRRSGNGSSLAATRAAVADAGAGSGVDSGVDGGPDRPAPGVERPPSGSASGGAPSAAAGRGETGRAKPSDWFRRESIDPDDAAADDDGLRWPEETPAEDELAALEEQWSQEPVDEKPRPRADGGPGEGDGRRDREREP